MSTRHLFRFILKKNTHEAKSYCGSVSRPYNSLTYERRRNNLNNASKYYGWYPQAMSNPMVGYSHTHAHM